MTTVGEILKNARVEKKLQLSDVEKATKIRSKFLEALENNQFDKLPPRTFTKGFIKNYASYLGLPTEEILAFYRRQVNEETVPVLSLKGPKIGRFSLTPQFFTSFAIGTLVVLFFVYLAFSYFQFAGSPTLVLNQPKNNSVSLEEQTQVVGKTDPEAILSINGQVVIVSGNGSFDVKIPLQPGLNTLTVTATNKFKRQTTIVRNLRLEK